MKPPQLANTTPNMTTFTAFHWTTQHNTLFNHTEMATRIMFAIFQNGCPISSSSFLEFTDLDRFVQSACKAMAQPSNVDLQSIMDSLQMRMEIALSGWDNHEFLGHFKGFYPFYGDIQTRNGINSGFMFAQRIKVSLYSYFQTKIFQSRWIYPLKKNLTEFLK